jgi:hypothetical protein
MQISVRGTPYSGLDPDTCTCMRPTEGLGKRGRPALLLCTNFTAPLWRSALTVCNQPHLSELGNQLTIQRSFLEELDLGAVKRPTIQDQQQSKDARIQIV